MERTIQAILRRDFAAFAANRKLPLHVHHAARSMMRCRTAALGGHVMACSAGHVAGVWYNSCRHRACPQCSKLQIDRWLAGWRERLLPCDHYHVIFTLPHELLDLWRANRKRMTEHLFRSARDTLLDLLQDERHLGALPGVISALHTWGRTLTLHPHLHCLVTGGGLDREGDWRPVRRGFLLPVRVVKALFRGRFMGLVQNDLEHGRLIGPGPLSEMALSNQLRRAYSKSWNVRIQERYAHGHGVIDYLARYVRGGPIRNRRLLAASSTRVAFSYRDHRDGRHKRMTLGTEEFLGRLLWHVPEPRSHVVRSYGVYARSERPACEACRARIVAAGLSHRPVRGRVASVPPRPACPLCGRPVGLLGPLRRRRVFRLEGLVLNQLKSP